MIYYYRSIARDELVANKYKDKLDPGLSKRPSRFDRKYLFPIPNEHERLLYCEYWRNKLKSNPSVVFPEKLCPAMAHITPGFSFAFLKECFVATLLALAREDDDPATEWRPYDSDNDDLEDYKLWVTFKEQAEILRKELENQKTKQPPLLEWYRGGEPSPNTMAASAAHAKQSPQHCHCCQHSCGSKHDVSPARAMGRLRLEDKLLPDLPWEDQKHLFVNSGKAPEPCRQGPSTHEELLQLRTS